MEKKPTILNNKYFQTIIKGCLVMCLVAQCMGVKSQVKTLTVIRNQKGAPEAMKFSDLKSVMMAQKQRWNGGTKVTVAIMTTNTPLGEKTAQVIYNMSNHDLLKFRLDLSFQGNVQAPKFFNTVSELENYVVQTPGAIGVIEQPSSNNEIKTILIDGKTQFDL